MIPKIQSEIFVNKILFEFKNMKSMWQSAQQRRVAIDQFRTEQLALNRQKAKEQRDRLEHNIRKREQLLRDSKDSSDPPVIQIIDHNDAQKSEQRVLESRLSETLKNSRLASVLISNDSIRGSVQVHGTALRKGHITLSDTHSTALNKADTRLRSSYNDKQTHSNIHIMDSRESYNDLVHHGNGTINLQLKAKMGQGSKELKPLLENLRDSVERSATSQGGTSNDAKDTTNGKTGTAQNVSASMTTGGKKSIVFQNKHQKPPVGDPNSGADKHSKTASNPSQPHVSYIRHTRLKSGHKRMSSRASQMNTKSSAQLNEDEKQSGSQYPPNQGLDTSKIHGSQFFRQKLENSQTLQSQYQSFIPVAAPVIIDPNSYQGSFYQAPFQRNLFSKATANKFNKFQNKSTSRLALRQTMSMRATSESHGSTKSATRAQSSSYHGKYRQPNYMNQHLVARFQAQQLEEKQQRALEMQQNQAKFQSAKLEMSVSSSKNLHEVDQNHSLSSIRVGNTLDLGNANRTFQTQQILGSDMSTLTNNQQTFMNQNPQAGLAPAYSDLQHALSNENIKKYLQSGPLKSPGILLKQQMHSSINMSSQDIRKSKSSQSPVRSSQKTSLQQRKKTQQLRSSERLMLNSHSNINVIDPNQSGRITIAKERESEQVVTEYGDAGPDRSKSHLNLFLKSKDRDLTITQQENQPEGLATELPTNTIQQEERGSNFREIESEAAAKPPVLVKSKLRSKSKVRPKTQGGKSLQRRGGRQYQMKTETEEQNAGASISTHYTKDQLKELKQSGWPAQQTIVTLQDQTIQPYLDDDLSRPFTATLTSLHDPKLKRMRSTNYTSLRDQEYPTVPQFVHKFKTDVLGQDGEAPQMDDEHKNEIRKTSKFIQKNAKAIKKRSQVYYMSKPHDHQSKSPNRTLNCAVRAPKSYHRHSEATLGRMTDQICRNRFTVKEGQSRRVPAMPRVMTRTAATTASQTMQQESLVSQTNNTTLRAQAADQKATLTTKETPFQTNNKAPDINIQESLQVSANIPEIDIMEQFVYQKDEIMDKIPNLPLPQIQTMSGDEYDMEGPISDVPESQSERIVDKIDDQIKQIMRTITLDEYEKLDQDEVNERLFDKFRGIYAQIEVNFQTHGYAKSPDFRWKQEKLQRINQDKWMKLRGKSTSPTAPRKVILNEGIDFVQVKDAIEYQKKQTNDKRAISGLGMFLGEETQHKPAHYDAINVEILQFCSQLFLNWLEDYREQVQRLKEMNLTHHTYLMNEAVERNISEQCLPVDYFIERMFQLGLVSTTNQLKLVLDTMYLFDNPGFQDPERGEEKNDGPPSITLLNSRDEHARNFVIRQCIDQKWLRKTDRVSISQFLSLFNIMGVENAMRLDKVVEVLKMRLREKHLKEDKEANKERYKQAMMKSYLNSWAGKEPLKTMPSAEQKKKCCLEAEALAKKQELERQKKENYTVEDLKSVTPYQRSSAGKVLNSLERQSHILKLQQDYAFDEFAPDFIYELDNVKKGGRAFQIEASARLNERYYQFLMKKMKKVAQKLEDVKIEEMYEESVCSSRRVGLKDKLKNKIGHVINPQHIVQQIKGARSFSQDVPHVCDDEIGGSKSDILEESSSIVSKGPATPVKSRSMTKKQYSRSPPNRGSIKSIKSPGKDKSRDLGSPMKSQKSQHSCSSPMRRFMSKSLTKTMTLDKATLELLKKKEQERQDQLERKLYSNKFYKAYRKIADSLDVIRKQMVLTEICHDINRVTSILEGMLKYDSVDKTVRADLKSPARVNRMEGLNKRQFFRKEFSQFIMKDLREKYSKQMFMFYEGDEARLYGKDLTSGATVEMTRQAIDYGIQARTLLIHISAKMIKHKVKLGAKEYINIHSIKKRKWDAPDGQGVGILGWWTQLNKHEDISKPLNNLVNLVIDQINDRESTMAYPNEEAGELMEMGDKIWTQQIDPGTFLIIPRRHVDQFLIKNNVVRDYKEINRLLAGCLSGAVIRAHENIKKSDFLKLLTKGILRNSIKNIIVYTKLGMDTTAEKDAIPFSHQVQRYQRYILYCGVKTKNSQGVPIKSRQEFLDRSVSCMNIVSNLQQLKQNKGVVSKETCKIQREEHKQWFKKMAAKMEEKHHVISDVVVPTPENNGNDRQDSLARQQARQYEQDTINSLIHRENKKRSPSHKYTLNVEDDSGVKRQFAINVEDPQSNTRKSVQDLPQFKVAVRKKHQDMKAAEVAEILYNNREDQLFRDEFGKFDKTVGNPNEMSDIQKQVFDNVYGHKRRSELTTGSRQSQQGEKQNEEQLVQGMDEYKMGRLSLIERQLYRSQISQALLSRAVNINKKLSAQ